MSRRLATIGEIVESVAIGPFGSRMKADLYTADGVRVIRGTNLMNGRTLSGDWVYVSNETANGLSACNVLPGDLVFPHRGSIGEVGIAPADGNRYILSSSLMRLRCDLSTTDPLYLYYFFKSRDGRYQLLKNASQVGTPGIGQPLASLKGVALELPPITQQRAVSSVLSALDDKIELNRRMNETLEAMARALFKDWFIDFGPVRAKMEGRQPPGLSSEIAALFPDKLSSDDVPNGWQILPLDQIADFLNGLALQKYPADGNDDLPVIKIAQMRTGITEGSAYASGSIPSRYVVSDGDVLFSWSGSLTQMVWTGGRGALNQHLFKVTSQKYPKWMHYLWVDHHLPSFQAIAASKATTMGHIQRHHLTEALATVPDDTIIRAADSLLSPLMQRIVALDIESRSLSSLRDLLLPQLLSGSLRIRAVENVIERVA